WGYKHVAQEQQSAKKDAPALVVSLELLSASSVKMSPIEWVWPNRIAVGKLTLFAGLPDQGKSQLSCDIAARITTTSGDKNWPCKEGTAPPATSLSSAPRTTPATLSIRGSSLPVPIWTGSNTSKWSRQKPALDECLILQPTS